METPVRPSAQRFQDWRRFTRCLLWCMLAALSAGLLFQLGPTVILLIVLVACPVAAVWVYLLAQNPLPTPVGPRPVTRGLTLNWLAPWYDRCSARLGLTHDFRVRIIELADVRSGDHVLDLGCRTGALTCLAACRAGNQGKVHGIDAAPDMVRIARERPIGSSIHPQFDLAAPEALPFPDSSFDVILTSFLLSAFPEKLKLVALEEAYRVLKPGGRLVVAEIDRPAGMLGRCAAIALSASSRLRCHLRGKTAELLRNGGFVPIRLEAWRPFIVIWSCWKPDPSGGAA